MGGPGLGKRSIFIFFRPPPSFFFRCFLGMTRFTKNLQVASLIHSAGRLWDSVVNLGILGDSSAGSARVVFFSQDLQPQPLPRPAVTSGCRRAASLVDDPLIITPMDFASAAIRQSITAGPSAG
jgi:hypothetical protein